MKCPNCNKEIADDAKFCTECGHNLNQTQQNIPVQPQGQPEPEKKKKKPLWLKIVIGVVCLFILFSMLGSCSDSSDSSESSTVKTTSSSTNTEETTTVVESNTSSYSSQKKESSSYDKTKTTSENQDKSTPINVYKNLKKYPTNLLGMYDFNMSSKAKDFITKHPELFPAVSSDVCIDYVDYSIEFKHLSRDVDEYGDVMLCENGEISDIKKIKPEETGLDNTISEIEIRVDNPENVYIDDVYYLYYIGELDFYIGDEICVYGVPMGMVYERPVIAAAHVEGVYSVN